MRTLNAKKLNKLTYNYQGDLTGFQAIWRAKNDKEDTSAPIIEVLGSITNGATSTIVFIIDLTTITTLSETFYYEIEINDGAGLNATPTTAPIFTIQPIKGKLVKRLDN